MTKRHRMSGTKFHAIWHYKVKMCKEHQRYIKGRKYPEYDNNKPTKDVCKEWLDDFINYRDDMFKEWLMASMVWGKNNVRLCRKYESRPYCKDNCFFAGSLKQ